MDRAEQIIARIICSCCRYCVAHCACNDAFCEPGWTYDYAEYECGICAADREFEEEQASAKQAVRETRLKLVRRTA